jgi:ACR3 family arsenite efflux pump ArsB
VLFRSFARWLPAGQIDSYVAGLILLAAAPCTAMVFVWSRLTGGNAEFTLSQVALNDTIMVFAFAPIVGLLLGMSSISVPWDTLLVSVLLYIVIPVAAAQLWRRALLRKGEATLQRTVRALDPLSIGALLLTLVAGTWWAADSTQRSIPVEAPRRLTHEPDSWAQRFVMLRADAGGMIVVHELSRRPH